MAQYPTPKQSDDKSNSRPTGETKVDHPIDPKPAAEKPMSADELSGVQAFLNKHLSADKEDETKPPKPTPKAAPFKPKAAPNKPKAAQPEAAPALTAAEIAAAAAEGVARGMAKPVTEKEPEKPAATLKEADQRKVAVLKKMEELYGEANPKYKGISGRYSESIIALQEYAKKWEAEHPGKTFDEEDPEHEEFFKLHDVDWADEDFDDARIAEAADRIVDQRLKPTQKELEALQRENRLNKSQAEIKLAQDDAARTFWSKFGEGYGDIVDANGNVNSVKLEELAKSDPERLRVMVNAARAIDVEAAEIHKLYAGLVENDVKGNPAHRNINAFVASMEQALMKRPIQERTNEEGKDFLPAVKYWNLTKAEREKYWTFTEQDVKYMRVTDIASAVQKQIAEQEAAFVRWAKARGLPIEEAPAASDASNGAAAVPPEPGADPAEMKEAASAEKPQSPSDSGGPRMAAARGAREESAQSAVSAFANRFLGVK
jgi:ribosomal protein L7/L12